MLQHNLLLIINGRVPEIGHDLQSSGKLLSSLHESCR